ncbi:sarcospan-like [Oncorhynchus nerka]|uniref:sarcospan-like n=1 Tax=Oncorhynchus nerka TaxID=8023 RepID=UPI0031B86BA6
MECSFLVTVPVNIGVVVMETLLYFILCAMGLVLSSLVMAFFGHHYAQTNGFSCLEVGDDCVCTLNPHDPIPRTFPYAEVSNCGEVTGTLKL